MIDRRHIEKILRINGLSPIAEDEEIRSVLISAKWHKDDVETALTVLRENTTTGQAHVDVLHNVFNSDARLSPEAIQSLLGIDVELTSDQVAALHGGKRTVSLASTQHYFVCHGIGIWFYYISDVHSKCGIFHPAV
ncbi:MAG: hypothetical protein R3B69_00595 [Candidatus Paceibacterota bacterium]